MGFTLHINRGQRSRFPWTGSALLLLVLLSPPVLNAQDTSWDIDADSSQSSHTVNFSRSRTTQDSLPTETSSYQSPWGINAMLPLMTSAETPPTVLDPQIYIPGTLCFLIVILLVVLRRTIARQKESDGQFRRLFDAAPTPLLQINHQGDIVAMNQRFTDVFGISGETQLTIDEWLTRDHPDPDQCALARTKWDTLRLAIVNQSSGSTSQEFQLTDVNGQQRLMILSGNKLDETLVISFYDITNRTEKERATRESECKYRRYLMDAPTAVFITDRDGNFQEVNATACKMTGYPPEEVINLSLLDLLPSTSQEAGRKSLQRLVVSGRETAHLKYQLRDGRTGWWSMQACAFTDQHYLLFMEDITTRKHAEEALISKEEFLSSIIDQSPFATFITDAQGLMQRANPMLRKSLNLRDEQLVGTYNILQDPIARKNGVLPLIRSVFEKGKSIHFSLQWDGSQIEQWDFHGSHPVDIEATMFPIFNSEHQLTNTVIQWIDVTQRKHTETVLRRSEQNYKNLFTAMLDGFAEHEIILDDNGSPIDYRFLSVNPAFESITGLDSETLLGKRASEVMPDLEPFWIETYGNVALTGESVRFEHYAKTLEKYFQVHAFQSDTGRFACIFQDITEQREMEKRIRQMEKMNAIGQLAGGVAHDFNNQLAGIVGYADMLVARLDDPTLIRYAQHILTGGRRAADLTKQLLAFSHKGQYQSLPVDLHETITEVIGILSHSIDKRIEIRQILESPEPVVIGDPSQLQNALLNLALNARDAMPEGGELTFETRNIRLDYNYCRTLPYEIQPGMYLQIAITDTGCGMDADVKKHIFEPFFTTKEQGEGTGMGLAAVYGTVKHLEGAINLYSEIGTGTTFRLYLPLAKTEARTKEQVGVLTRAPYTARILVVDDEDLFRNLASDMLVGAGYNVITKSNGEEGVAYYESHWQEIDLVILDMIMPQLDGKHAFYKMRSINPNVKVLLSSGYSINGEAQKLLNDGIYGFLQKPFMQAEWTKTVAEIIGLNPVSKSSVS